MKNIFTIGFALLAFAVKAQVLVCDVDFWRNPVPHGFDLNGIDNSRALFVAVGDYGIIQSSEDGLEWTLESPPIDTDYDFHSVKFLGETGEVAGWLAVGENGLISLSSDGKSWSLSTHFSFGSLEDILLGNGELFVIGDTTQVYQMGTWVSANISANKLWAGTFQGGEFHLVGANIYLKGPSVFNLTQVQNTPSVHFKDIVVNGSFAYLLDHTNTLHRFDGANWVVLHNFGQRMYGLSKHSNGLYAFGEEGAFFSSQSGMQWQEHNSPTNQRIFGLALGTPNILVGSGGMILTSPDVTNWTKQTTGWDFYGTTMGGTENELILFSRTQGTAIKSLDGVNWQNINGDFKDIHFLHSFSGGWVGVGNGRVIYSPDGLSWNQAPFSSILQYWKVTGWDNLLAVSSSEFAYSSDGTNWTIYNHGLGESMTSVAQNATGRFVAVGNNGKLAYSDDGLSWSQVVGSGQHSGIFYDVSYGNGIFVAVGSSNTIAVSPDGIIWNIVFTQNGTTDYFSYITFGEGKFWLLQHTDFFYSNSIWTSQDGVKWKKNVPFLLNKTYELKPFGSRLFASGFASNWVVYKDIGNEINQWPLPITLLDLVPSIGSCELNL